MKVSGPMRFVFRVAALLVLIAFAVFCWVKVQPTDPQENLCDQGARLNEARLLQKARETFVRAGAEGHNCSATERGEVERGLGRAETSFASARALGSIEPTGSKESKSAAAQRNASLAIDRYVSGLDLNPFDEAAHLGLGVELNALAPAAGPKAAMARCRLAARLTTAGLLDAAGTTVPKGLEQAPEQCGEALGDLNRRRVEASILAREAQQLSAEGGSGEAVRERYAEALLANAQLTEARSGIEDSTSDESILDAAGSWLAGIPGTLKKALDWLLPLAALLLAALLLIGTAVRLVTRSPRVSQRLAIWSMKRPGLAFLRYAAVPQIAVTDFDGGSESGAQGRDFSALLAEMLPKKAGREPLFPFDQVTKGSENDQKAAELSDVLAEVPQAKVLGGAFKLFGRLLRRRTISVGGHLAPISDTGGAGVTVTLDGGGRDLDSNITLWEQTFDPLVGGEKDATRWLRLAAPATVWARWQIAARILPDLDPKQWRADALFQTGAAWESQGDMRRAEALYVEVLELDSALLPAAHNLAVIEIRDRRYSEARERLLKLQDQLKTNPEMRGNWPLLETGYLYTLMLAYAYDSGGGEGDDSNLLAARKVSRQLVGMVARHLSRKPDEVSHLDRKLGEVHVGGDDLAELRQVESPSVVVLATLTAAYKPRVRREAVGRLAEKTATEKIERADLRDRLADLKPWDLVDGYVLVQPNLTRRTHYNLACYYTGLAEGAGERREMCLDLAIDSLRKAMEGRGLSKWVHDDPSLEPLRQGKRWRRFEKFLEKHAIVAHPGGGE